MSLGMILLVVVTILILFGVLHRVLDRMRLTDRQALAVVAAIFIGGILPDIQVTPLFRFNIGGALIPLAMCVYLFVKAGTGKERFRAVAASVLAAAGVFILGKVLPAEPSRMGFDPNYIYGPVAGLIAYIFGRSRRAAFIAGVMGVLLADTLQAVINWTQGISTPLNLGGAGAFDAVVLSGLLAVLLAEAIGEALERAQGGSRRKETQVFDHGEFVERDHAGEGGKGK